MSVGYKSIQWNRQKIIYDLILLAAVGAYIAIFMAVTKGSGGDLDLRGVRIRAYGSAAFVLLHVILSIGPLTRLNPRFYPLLFNRRHMGVTMFFLALIHVVGLKLPGLPTAWQVDGVLTWYHDFGNLDPWVSLLVGNSQYATLIQFPFEILGLVALAILFVMAATSHDFWLHNLTAPIWKTLHMGVYAAYALLVGHVVLGALQTNRHPLLTVAVLLGFVWIMGVHLVAGNREAKRDAVQPSPNQDGFVPVGSVDEIPDDRAKVVTIAGERVAIFKYDGKISAISNVCQHQNGPLGDCKVVDGCITCPWHGYQYQPDTGASPPPFAEAVPTFEVRLEGNHILVKAIPNPPGTQVTPAVIA